jgi:hypothetical protein
VAVKKSLSGGSDKEFSLPGLRPSTTVTLYSAKARAGILSLVINPDGTIDEDRLIDVAVALQDGHLPDGRLLEQAYVLLPDRESAVAVREIASRCGIQNVLYTDDDGGMRELAP